jgi:hypothetical protein
MKAWLKYFKEMKVWSFGLIIAMLLCITALSQENEDLKLIGSF